MVTVASGREFSKPHGWRRGHGCFPLTSDAGVTRHAAEAPGAPLPYAGRVTCQVPWKSGALAPRQAAFDAGFSPRAGPIGDHRGGIPSRFIRNAALKGRSATAAQTAGTDFQKGIPPSWKIEARFPIDRLVRGLNRFYFLMFPVPVIDYRGFAVIGQLNSRRTEFQRLIGGIYRVDLGNP